MSADTDTPTDRADQPRWLTPGVGGIGIASLLSDLGHEVPTSLLATWSSAPAPTTSASPRKTSPTSVQDTVDAPWFPRIRREARQTLGAPASALGVIEGISDGLAGAARLGGGAR